MLKKELNIFFTAIMFFTRIPIPKWIDSSSETLKECAKYFSLIGIIIGAFGGLVYFTFSLILPQNIAILLSIIGTIWATGAFHEDGFADVCDGLGGGYTKEKILLIMKDSLVGTYGIVGLISLLLLKYITLLELSNYFILICISGHSVSRFLASSILFLYPYARTEETSKGKPVASSFTFTHLLINGIIGCLPLFFFSNYWVFLTLIPSTIAMLLLGRFFNKWIGGQTGDCAGATQQITEVVFYLSILILWKFI